MYNGWDLALSERRKIYAAIKPIHNDLYFWPLVWRYQASEPPTATTGSVIGSFNADGNQLLIFEVEGTFIRPDGRHLHLSWSRDYALITNTRPYSTMHPLIISDWAPLDQPVTVTLIPRLFSKSK